LLEVLLY